MTTAAPPAPVGVSKEHITKTPGVCGGKACIAGHRIRVLDVVLQCEPGGLTPQEFVAQFPGVTLADVHAALAYAYDHPNEIEADLRRGQEMADRYRSQFPPKIPAKLKARESADG